MSLEEFNKRIEASEEDFANGREIDAKELLKKIDVWE